MKTLLVLFNILFCLNVKAENHFPTEACEEAAYDATLVAFAELTGTSKEVVSEFAIVERPFIAEGDPEEQITVNVETRDSRDWDGSATYKITVETTSMECVAVKTELVSSSGI